MVATSTLRKSALARGGQAGTAKPRSPDDETSKVGTNPRTLPCNQEGAALRMAGSAGAYLVPG
jgi:hypothetical protein